MLRKSIRIVPTGRFLEAVPGAIRAGALGAMLSIGLLVSASPVEAASACSSGNAVLGQTPALTGTTPTSWFNVTGERFASSAQPTMTFSVPVIPWIESDPTTVAAPVTTFSLPAGQSPDLGFKWTFRAATASVQRITVRIVGQGCAATTVVDFAAPATSTAAAVPDRTDLGPGRLLVLGFAFGVGGFALWRRTGRA